MMAKNMTISTSNFFSPAAAPNAIPSAVGREGGGEEVKDEANMQCY